MGAVVAFVGAFVGALVGAGAERDELLPDDGAPPTLLLDGAAGEGGEEGGCEEGAAEVGGSGGADPVAAGDDTDARSDGCGVAATATTEAVAPAGEPTSDMLCAARVRPMP